MKFDISQYYAVSPEYGLPVAYFSMEYAIHQALRTYAGGLGFLAGSHMRSAYALGQNMVGIGILWKYGYYTQGRKTDQTMDVLFQEHGHRFLQATDIAFSIKVNGHEVRVGAYFLAPATFQTAPVFFLTTDLPQNDHLARTICHKLYDPNPETKLAAAILLGRGGARLLEEIGYSPAIYHMNESHGLPLAFYLYDKYRSVEEVKKRLVFTNHTPEASGNQQSEINQLSRMGYFGELSLDMARKVSGAQNDILDHSLTAFRLAGVANGVSRMHLQTLQKIWGGQKDVCPLIGITNAQSAEFWRDREMYASLEASDDASLWARKKACKAELFEEVADQCGVFFDPNVLTVVFARRFTGYKRPELLLHDLDLLRQLLGDRQRPVQLIWAGKPYPMDYDGIGSFDKLVNLCRVYPNCAILTGYELRLSRLLKRGADVWLNTPRLTHEASGTSGMSAAMNGAVNVSIPDGWFPEFVRDGINSFVIPDTEVTEHKFQQDETDAHNLYALLQNKVIPLFYDHPDQWLGVVKNSMRDILPRFDSERMAGEYYRRMYMG